MISLIIPVYNVEKYLDQCLSSMLNQTYDKIEIIIINDGSSDRSASICENYARKDNRIKYFNQENIGVSKTRKRGVELASFNFVLFIDADDWLELDACETLIEKITDHNPDIISFGYFRSYSDKSIPALMLGEDKVISTPVELVEMNRRIVGLVGEELLHPHRFDAFSSMKKVYRKDLIQCNSIEFLDTSYITPGEDMIFNVMAYSYANKVIHIERPLYYYRRGNFSSETGVYRNDFYEKWQNRLDYLEVYLKKRNFSPEFFEAFNNRICCELIGLGQKVTNPNNKASLLAKVRMFCKILSSERYRAAFSKFKIKYLPFHWKIFFLFCSARFGLGVLLMSMGIRFIKSKY